MSPLGSILNGVSVNHRARGLVDRALGRVRPLRRSAATHMPAVVGHEEFLTAWHELREHPSLRWTPPLWRTTVGSTDGWSSAHVLSAIDRNLVVQIHTEGLRPRVELATGPLHDREIGGGVDPTTPVGKVDPKLRVQAATFEEAVICLRDAVVRTYGPAVERVQDGRAAER